MEGNKVFKQSKWPKTLIFEKSTPGRTGYQVPELSSEEEIALEKGLEESSDLKEEMREIKTLRKLFSEMEYSFSNNFYNGWGDNITYSTLIKPIEGTKSLKFLNN